MLRGEIRRKEHLAGSVRGSAFPGRRVSTHRHTCLRKAPFAYASRSHILPEPGTLSSARFHASEELPFSSSLVSPARRGSVVVHLEKKDRECEGTLRTQLKRYARTRPSSRTTFFLPPPSFFVPLFFSSYIFYIFIYIYARARVYLVPVRVQRVLDEDDDACETAVHSRLSFEQTSFTNPSLSIFLLILVSYLFASSS